MHSIFNLLKRIKSVKMILLTLVFFIGIREIHCQDFSYDGSMGPEHWRELYNTCNGKYQSPINIDIHNVRQMSFPPLQITGFNTTPEFAYVKNNGHTVQVTMDFSNPPTISGGPLDGIYEFSQFHYHWGDNNTDGSEDMIDDQSFPIELHIVFYKTKYNKFENALNFPDGIVVLAYFYELSDTKNGFYDEFSMLLDNIKWPGNTTKFMNGPMIRDLTTNDTEHYFTYTGSLTTPPCNEVVTWIDFATPIPISEEQISKFRDIYDHEGHHLTHNHRPIQPLNGRIIYENVPASETTPKNEYDDYLKPNENTNADINEEIHSSNDLSEKPKKSNNDDSKSDEIDAQAKTKNKIKKNSSPSIVTIVNYYYMTILIVFYYFVY